VRRLLLFALLFSSLVLVGGCADEGGGHKDDGDQDEVGLPLIFGEHEYLSDWSSWSSEFDHKSPKRLRELGGLGIGNGRVFSLVAAWLPFNRLHNLIGPDYQKHLRFFSDKIFHLYAMNTEVKWSVERAYRVRKSAINITYAEKSGVEFWTIDFAPKSANETVEKTLFRLIVVRNTGELAARGLSIRVSSPLGFIDSSGFLIEYIESGETDVRDKVLAGRFISEFVDVVDGMPAIHIGDLPPGAEFTTVYLFAFGYSEREAISTWMDVASVDYHGILDDTYDWWSEDSSNGAQVETSSRRFDDLIEGFRTTIRVQQAHLGGVSQMSEYSHTWARDITGPALFLTALGRFEEYKRMIDYYWYGVLIRGNMANAMPLDFDISDLPPQPDWDSMGEMTGRTAAETPSYVVWHYKLYYLATGDIDTLAERYGLLKHCIVHQAFREDGLLPFSDDETFRVPMMAVLGQPLNTHYNEIFYSANSSFLFVPVADFMKGIAVQLGYYDDAETFDELSDMVRVRAEEVYWIDDGKFYSPAAWMDTLEPVGIPYEDVATKPLWTGYSSPDDERAKTNLLTVMDMIGYPDGTIQSPMSPVYDTLKRWLDITDGVATGMTYGYYLDNLARVDHPMAEVSFLSFDKVFNDTGNTDEVVIHDDYSRFAYFFEPFGFLCDLTARYRSWEAGIDGAALLRYLFGLDLDAPNGRISIAPHLPAGWDKAKLLGARVGDVTFDLIVRQEEDERVVRIKNATGELTVDALVSVGGKIDEVKVNGDVVNASVEQNAWGRWRVKLDDLTASPETPLEIRVRFGE